MSENGVKNVDQCIPKPKPASSMSCFCPQLDIQFTVTEEERNQKTLTFKKLESENFDKPINLIAINLIVDN